VIIVGKENTGKTSLVKRITNQWTTFDSLLGKTIKQGRRKPTDGIETKIWNVGSTTFHLWDFAGQKIYYNTHQFFLSTDSVNLIVFDCTKDLKENKLEFWINSIKARAPNSSVYLVGTFVDKLSDKTREDSLNIISNAIEGLWKSIAGQHLKYTSNLF